MSVHPPKPQKYRNTNRPVIVLVGWVGLEKAPQVTSSFIHKGSTARLVDFALVFSVLFGASLFPFPVSASGTKTKPARFACHFLSKRFRPMIGRARLQPTFTSSDGGAWTPSSSASAWMPHGFPKSRHLRVPKEVGQSWTIRQKYKSGIINYQNKIKQEIQGVQHAKHFKVKTAQKLLLESCPASLHVAFHFLDYERGSCQMCRGWPFDPENPCKHLQTY